MSVKTQREISNKKRPKQESISKGKVVETSYSKPDDIRKNTKRARQPKRAQNKRVYRKEKLERHCTQNCKKTKRARQPKRDQNRGVSRKEKMENKSPLS